MRHAILFLTLFLNTTLVFSKVVNIGVLAYNGKPQAIQRWQPTADYLSQELPNHSFHIQPLTHEEFKHSINKKSIDFILTNPGHFVLLEVERDVTSIATLVSRYENQDLNHFSAVLMVRNDGEINDLSDLKGKTLAAVNEQAFGGFKLAQYELLKSNIDVKQDLDVLWLGFPHVDLVMSVLEGKADVATVRSGVLEKMAAQGLIDLNKVKILAKKEEGNFPFYRSFSMYPEWPFAKLPHTDLALAKDVVSALLTMSSQHRAAVIANGAGWTVPFNYASVHEVLKTLQTAPYLPRPFSMNDLWQSYKQWILVVVTLFMVSILLLVRFYQSNKQLQTVQNDLQKSQLFLEQAVVNRTEELKSINVSLESEIAKHIETETELNKGCEALQSIYSIFVREDLNRKQKLNSVVDALRFYLDFEKVMLSQVEHSSFTLCCVRPNDVEMTSPLSESLAKQTIQQKQPFFSQQQDEWANYLACPIFLNGELNYILELATSREYKAQETHTEDSRLSHHILYLIAHWIGYEALSVSKEEDDENKNKALVERFSTITSRESEVIKLLVQGESNKSMAKLLNLSVKTIEMHRANALRKVEAKSSTEIVQMAVLSGLFENT